MARRAGSTSAVLAGSVLALLSAACSAGAGAGAPPPPGEPEAGAHHPGVGAPDDPATGAGTEGSARARAPRLIPLGRMTADVEILFGDPMAEGEPFVIRIRESAGIVIPPHSHPVDEHITVVQGTWYFGLGEAFDSTALQALPVGSYAFAPAGTTMFAYAPEAAVVQVHGIGPFHIHWKDGLLVLGETGSEGAFRFRLGEEVSTPRGTGEIVWGGVSGDLVQYEIRDPDGTVFAAREHEVRRR